MRYCLRDKECTLRSIPRHLHKLNRKKLDSIPSAELFYRRFPLFKADITEAISFDPKKNSVNRKGLCRKPEDVLVDPETGEVKNDFGILAIPQSALQNKSWNTDSNVFSSCFEHDPLKCNYAHYNMVLRCPNNESRQPSKALRLLVRRALMAEVKIVRPSRLNGHRFAKEKGGGDVEGQSMTIPPCP